MLPALYLVWGLLAVVAGVVGLAGPWWGLLVAGTALVVLGVLEARGSSPAADPDVDERATA